MSDAAEPAPQTEPADALVGTILADRYRIESLLGAGGMGAVYKAVHVNMRKTVALKVLHPEMAAIPEALARFEREGIAAAKLEHPNIASALDFGKLPDGSFYLVMEFIPGTLLRDALEAGAMSPERVVRLGGQIAAALEAAHAAGIVHRDLKPENVMLRGSGEQETVKVLDLGIAKVTVDDPRPGSALTKVGAVLGTPQYMAPEQGIGAKVDHRADLYALGVMLYEMVAGVVPFPDTDGPHAVIARHITEPPPALPPTVPQPLATLVLGLLAKSAAERPQSAAEVSERLRAVFAERPATAVGAEPQPAREDPPGGVPARKRGHAILLASALGLVAVLAWFATRSANDADDAASSPPNASAAAVAAPPAASAAPDSNVGAPRAADALARSAAPAAKANTPVPKPAHGKGKKKEQRKTGPGGIYVPPPEDWF